MKYELIKVGWREWVALPDIGLPYIKAKIDSGKQTSILHTFMTEHFEKQGVSMIRFGVHPCQNNRDTAVICEAPILEKKEGSNAEGEKETQYIIQTDIHIGDIKWPIKLLLANRDDMNFRLLLGHSAIDNKFIIDPSESYLTGNISEDELVATYKK